MQETSKHQINQETRNVDSAKTMIADVWWEK